MTDRAMIGEEVPPRAGALIASMRSLGYTLPTALADLIDNSVAAGATEVRVWIVGHSKSDNSALEPHIAVFDNGRGMDQETLVEAMRMGGDGPGGERAAGDLGRFRLGLKTASISQGRRLGVVSKTKSDAPIHRCLDLDHIAVTDKFTLLRGVPEEASSYLHLFEGRESGTLVIIGKLDRPQFLRVAKARKDLLGLALEEIQFHLGMVFHRFIEDGRLRIFLGDTEIEAWDPFLRAKSTKLPKEILNLHDSKVEIKPFILPHRSLFGEDEKGFKKAAGQKGWSYHQGFYVYRGRRLISAGTWLNLDVTKEFHFNLARIQVDITNDQDEYWELDVMKSSVSPPSALYDDFTRIAKAVRAKANEVYRVRGEREVPNKTVPISHVWERKEQNLGISFKINRKHPAIDVLIRNGGEQAILFREVLSLIEKHLPLSTIVQDQSRVLDGITQGKDVDLREMVDLYGRLFNFLIQCGSTADEAHKTLLRSQPFASAASELKQHYFRK